MDGGRRRWSGRQYRFRPARYAAHVRPRRDRDQLGFTSVIRQAPEDAGSFATVAAAIVTTMFVTYLRLAYADKLIHLLGPLGIDASTRIVGFFVSAIGVGLIFVIEALETHGVTSLD